MEIKLTKRRKWVMICLQKNEYNLNVKLKNLNRNATILIHNWKKPKMKLII